MLTEQIQLDDHNANGLLLNRSTNEKGLDVLLVLTV